MPKAFSVISWNIEHFTGANSARLTRVVDRLRHEDPDVFGLYEIKGKDIWDKLVPAFPKYTFQITEGGNSQQILLGVRNTLTAFITQKLEFTSGNTFMRPGLLLNITVDSVHYQLLFLHLASGTQLEDMAIRYDMQRRACQFKAVLNREAHDKRANYIFLGDLNTMGFTYPGHPEVTTEKELDRLDKYAPRYYNMVRLPKTHETTFWNGPEGSLPKSNLDHVFASDHLKFQMFDSPDGTPKPVQVTGWVDEPTEKQGQWISEYSDHCLLKFVVERVASSEDKSAIRNYE